MLYDKLKDYSKSGVYPFHMPGHKRIALDDIIPYQIDLTEIYDFDNLHGASGCIKAVQEKAAKIYSVDYANMLVNGATGGILAAIRSLTNFGDKVFIARNCHKSVYNAVELCGLDAEYILPKQDDEFGIFMSVTPEQVENALKNNSARLVVVTSPTYEGIVSDIKSIADICHKYSAKLFVDEAHGAHFPFSSEFPTESVSLGADAAVVSLHKTLPSLTQTALLLTNDESLSHLFEKNLAVFETSSPSYILMSSVEICLDYIQNSSDRFYKYISNIKAFRHKCKKLKNLKIMNKPEYAFDYDIGKLVISTRNTDISGIELSQKLRQEYKIELEMAYSDYVIAMTSVCDSTEGFERLAKALFEIDSTIGDCNIINKTCNNISLLPDKVLKSCNINSKLELSIPLNNSVGKVSAEYVWAYPPGIPIVVAGELIDESIVNQINYLLNCGVEVYSTNGNLPNKINVIEFD